MNIVYAAEKPSIASILSEHVHARIDETDIDVRENPTETGSFLVDWGREKFVLLPDGQVARCRAIV